MHRNLGEKCVFQRADFGRSVGQWSIGSLVTASDGARTRRRRFIMHTFFFSAPNRERMLSCSPPHFATRMEWNEWTILSIVTSRLVGFVSNINPRGRHTPDARDDSEPSQYPVKYTTALYPAASSDKTNEGAFGCATRRRLGRPAMDDSRTPCRKQLLWIFLSDSVSSGGQARDPRNATSC